MTEGPEKRVPQHQTPLWSAVISGIILFVGGSIWSWVQSVLKGVPAGWVAAGVSVLALVALVVFVKPVRSWTSSAVGTAWSLRPVTWRSANRQAGEIAVADRNVIQAQDGVIKQLNRRLVEALALLDEREKEHLDQIDRVRRDELEQRHGLIRDKTTAVNAAWSRAQEYLAEVSRLSEIVRKLEDENAEPSALVPAPRFRLDAGGFGDEGDLFVLKNLMPGSVARGVRIEVDKDRFGLMTAGWWADLSGKSAGDFEGRLTLVGERHGADVTVSWSDASGWPQGPVVLHIEQTLAPGEWNEDVPY